MTVQQYSSGTPWEESIHYSRAVRRGNVVAVSGTTAMDGTQLVGAGDAGAQAHFIFKKIEASLSAVGAELSDVIRTRMYLVDANDAAAVTAAHAAFFRDIDPCASLLIVKGFISPELLVEIEVDAVLVES